jgi:alanine racemase
VGYGASQSLSRDSRLAVIGIGYADGFMRSLSATNTRQGGKVFLRGRLCPIVGKISMDMTIVDITDLGPNLPKPGEGVEVFGPNVNVDDQADVAGTIGYELLTSLKGRYSRNYVGNGYLPE